MLALEPDLSNRYNHGIVSAPHLAGGEAPRLQRPAWQPTPAQAQAARKQVGIGVVLLGLLVCACLALALGWRP